MKAEKILRPDAKGRICLGTLTNGISGYKAIINEATREIILKPYTEISFSEKWLYDNEAIFSSVKRGLKQSLDEEIIYKGSFAKFVDDNK